MRERLIYMTLDWSVGCAAAAAGGGAELGNASFPLPSKFQSPQCS